MTRRNSLFVPLAALTLAGAMLGMPKASAQNQSILAEVYGRGVHAFYAGQMTDAYNHLSSAINGGTRDPRAYYFRGIVAYNQGRVYEAEADWNQGATMEATAGGAAGVGRALSRFQGSGRLKLEEIRQEARLTAMLNATERSDTRRNELGISPAAPTVTDTNPATPPATITPAPAAPAADVPDNPFSDDAGAAMAGGQPELESDNAMAGLDENPFKDDPPAAGGAPAAAGGAAAGDNPFGAPAAGGDNPFGEPAASPAPAGNNPFDAPAGDDPFGNPFE